MKQNKHPTVSVSKSIPLSELVATVCSTNKTCRYSSTLLVVCHPAFQAVTSCNKLFCGWTGFCCSINVSPVKSNYFCERRALTHAWWQPAAQQAVVSKWQAAEIIVLDVFVPGLGMCSSLESLNGAFSMEQKMISLDSCLFVKQHNLRRPCI